LSYQALYRKFRPKTFDEVKGQDHIVTTLRNQLKAGRIGHAYLFCGTRGTGKTTVAKILARAVNCEHPAEDGSPCNTCDICQDILKGVSPNVIEIDAASNNGVDNVRQIREEVAYRPTQGKYKVYIIDEVHMLSAGAFNALLKTLEEPPEYVIFILATTEVNKIPITILSRCQRYNFHRITIDTISDRLRELLDKEGVKAEDRAVRYIAKMADGSMRDALSLLDQCIAFYLGQELTYDNVLKVLGTVDTDTFSALLRCVIAGDVSGSIRILHDIIRDGREMGQFVNDFIWYLRNLLLVQNSDDLEDVLDVSTENLKQLKEESTMIDSNGLMRYIRILSDLSGQMRFASQKQVLVETALIRLCRPEMDTDMEGILDRIRVLEKKVAEGVVVQKPAEGSGTVYRASPEKKPEPKVAAPEDLKVVRSRWNEIYARLSNGAPKIYLKGTTPSYDGENGGNILYLPVKEPMGVKFLNGYTSGDKQYPRYLKQVEDVIAEVTGLAVQTEAVLAGSEENNNVSEIPLEERLASAIDMDIQTDEGAPDDDVFGDAGTAPAPAPASAESDDIPESDEYSIEESDEDDDDSDGDEPDTE
jgi:DNA polymerase-3 subunit gamma/tau